ncbi:hypothetical protein [Sphaerisporangium aureirubrum]|uniref:Uncharacterized protein n=1 Tax=Sphaerisporangium aureirubrum TaxID=1544736 RepID=A0ABW1NCN3_9ACTN
MTVIGQAQGIEHGTPRGYRQHRYRKVLMCDDCLEANRKAVEAERAAKPRFASPEQAAWYGGRFTSSPDAASKPRDVRRAAGDSVPAGMILGRDLAVGDVIDFFGRTYPIDRFEPYFGSLLPALGTGTRIARSGDWGITAGPDAAIPVLPRPRATTTTTIKKAPAP